MTSTLSIKNFLCLKNVTLPLAERTFLVGKNNSGKSALGKALQFVHINVINYSSNNKTDFQIDEDTFLGNFSDVVFNHEENNSIFFELNFHSTYEEYFRLYDTDNSLSCLFLDSDDKEKDILKQLDKNAENEDIRNSDDLELLLLILQDHPHFYKSFLKDKFSDLNFSFNVVFSKDDNAQHLRKVKLIDKNTSASISFTPDIKYQFGIFDDWEINLKLFEDQKIESLFKNLPAKLKYIFFYREVDFPDIAQEIAAILIHFISDELQKNENWNELLISEQKKIIMTAAVQLLAFYKYFNMVICNHFSTFRFTSIRKIPEHKYILKNDKPPVIKDFGDLNLFLSKKDAEVIFAGPDYNEFHQVISEPEHTSWMDTFHALNILKLIKYCYLKKDNGIAEIRVVSMDGIDHNISIAGNELLHLLPFIFKMFNRYWSELKTNYIFIEHPELHLHTSKYKELVDILISEDQLLMVETHTQELIRQIQIKILNGEIKKENLSILHFMNHEGQTKVKALELNSKGIIKTPLPEDFDTTTPAAKQLTEADMN